jgi:hypothetical protein
MNSILDTADASHACASASPVELIGRNCIMHSFGTLVFESDLNQMKSRRNRAGFKSKLSRSVRGAITDGMRKQLVESPSEAEVGGVVFADCPKLEHLPGQPAPFAATSARD